MRRGLQTVHHTQTVPTKPHTRDEVLEAAKKATKALRSAAAKKGAKTRARNAADKRSKREATAKKAAKTRAKNAAAKKRKKRKKAAK